MSVQQCLFFSGNVSLRHLKCYFIRKMCTTVLWDKKYNTLNLLMLFDFLQKMNNKQC